MGATRHNAALGRKLLQINKFNCLTIPFTCRPGVTALAELAVALVVATAVPPVAGDG